MASAFGKMRGKDERLENLLLMDTSHSMRCRGHNSLLMTSTIGARLMKMFTVCSHSHFLVFTDMELKDFLKADAIRMGAFEQSAMTPMRAPPQPTMDTPNHTPPPQYKCHRCGDTFGTHHMLRTQKSMKHNVRCIASSLTPTNCCASCNIILRIGNQLFTNCVTLSIMATVAETTHAT